LSKRKTVTRGKMTGFTAKTLWFNESPQY